MKDHFSNQSKEYASFRPSYPLALFHEIYHYVKEFGTAWDCGTGNGQIAHILSNDFNRVLATDISENQIKYAPIKPNIDYFVEPVEQSNIEAHSLDLIVAGQAIHWFDLNLFYQKVQQTLKPNGIIAITGYGLIQTDPNIHKVIVDFYRQTLGNYWDPERKLVDEEYKTLRFPFREIPTKNFTWTCEWNFDHLIGYLSTWSAVQHFKKDQQTDPIALIKPKLIQAWGKSDKIQVKFPMLLRLGTLI